MKMIKSLKEKYPEYEKGKKTSKKVTDKARKNVDDKKKEDELRKKEQLEAKIRHQVACEEKAFRIVERLIENPIAEDFLIDACQFISPQHYDDIVEERAITRTCGYPLCSKPLTSVPKQKYHISTKDNKVYDITERKNFCSNQCYKASKYLQEQLSNSPLWARDKEENKVRVKLMTLNSGLPGLEVVGPAEKLMKEVHQLHKMDALDSKRTKKDEGLRNKEEVLRPNKTEDTIEEISLKTEELSLKEKVDSKNRNKSSELDSDDEIDEKVESNSQSTSVVKNDSVVGNGGQVLAKVDSTDIGFGLTSPSCPSKAPTSSLEPKAGSQKLDTEDKMQNLMKLLDRRKQLLNQLAEIETIKTAKTAKSAECKLDGKSVDQVQSGRVHTVEPGVGQVTEMERPTQPVEKMRTCNTCTNAALDDCSETPVKEDSCSDNKQKTVIKRKTEKFSTEEEQNILPSKAKSELKHSSHSVIQIICLSMKSWITPETIQLVQPVMVPDQTGVNQSRADYDAMYKALCRRIDAGEFEIEDVGREAEIGEEDNYRQRIPNYEMLKLETDEYSNRVKQYFAGDSSVKPVEKEDKDKTPVYLPTVDSYDQMQIRRKIVMEKLQRVLSDVLSPLKLTIQDVYTEYKEIIATFSLDSKNILFKPAEWTIINLILLRMMSKKNEKIHRAFQLPSSVAYFNILLGKLGTNLQQIDNFIEDLLLKQ